MLPPNQQSKWKFGLKSLRIYIITFEVQSRLQIVDSSMSRPNQLSMWKYSSKLLWASKNQCSSSKQILGSLYSASNCYERRKLHAPSQPTLKVHVISDQNLISQPTLEVQIRPQIVTSVYNLLPQLTLHIRSANSVSILLRTSKNVMSKPTFEVQIRFKLVKNIENEYPLPTNTRSANSDPKWTKMLWIDFENLKTSTNLRLFNVPRDSSHQSLAVTLVYIIYRSVPTSRDFCIRKLLKLSFKSMPRAVIFVKCNQRTKVGRKVPVNHH